MADINQEIEQIVAEMREVGKQAAPCKGGNYNNLLRYNELRERILSKFLEVFDTGGRLEMPTLTPPPITGDTSDGYHTFNELYHHRAILFSVICNERPDIAWKSKRHHDGTMYDGMFIVGIDTPEGQATYRYDIEPYWSMFRVKELELAPEWDGHTPDEAIQRIGTLTPPNEWVSVEERLPEKKQDVLMLFDGGNMAVGWWHDSDEYITFWCAYTDDGFYTDCDDMPVYWMPLPKPPTEEEA